MYSTQITAHVNAPRSAVYQALVDPAAVARWRVPVGMTGQVHEWDAREGGTFRIALSYDAPGQAGKSTSRTDIYHGHFEKLVPDERVVEVLEFEDPTGNFGGTMTMTTTLAEVDGGTDVSVVHEGIPDSVPAADNETGTRMALANLATFVQTS